MWECGNTHGGTIYSRVEKLMLKSWQFWSVMTAIGILTGLLAFGFTKNPKIVKSPLINLPASNFSVSELNTGEPLELAGLKGSSGNGKRAA